MNKFQKEIIKRRDKCLKIVGLGSVSYRTFIGWIRKKLKEDLKTGKVKL